MIEMHNKTIQTVYKVAQLHGGSVGSMNPGL